MSGPSLLCNACGIVTNSIFPFCDSCKKIMDAATSMTAPSIYKPMQDAMDLEFLRCINGYDPSEGETR